MGYSHKFIVLLDLTEFLLVLLVLFGLDWAFTGFQEAQLGLVTDIYSFIGFLLGFTRF